jgi:hypothetical protein
LEDFAAFYFKKERDVENEGKEESIASQSTRWEKVEEEQMVGYVAFSLNCDRYLR